jgi:[ribosomal protein S5]-alanine N-acetyltransferase
MTLRDAAPSQVAATARLVLRRLSLDDADFIVALLNDPAWLEFIGDRGVRTAEGARSYLEKGPMAMYARHGFGLYCVERKADGVPIGICGLIRREGLDDVDLGFAFLSAHRAQGYALESASVALAKSAFGLDRIVAITLPANRDSIRLLEKIGFRFERMVRLPKDKEENMLFACDTTRGSTP